MNKLIYKLKMAYYSITINVLNAIGVFTGFMVNKINKLEEDIKTDKFFKELNRED